MRAPLTLSLPPLVAQSDIEPQNVAVTGTIYTAFQLEEMRFFQVADRIAEMFQQGMLPIGRTAGSRVAKYVKAGQSRLSEAERRSVYARSLGVGGEGQAPEPNKDFNRLWIRCVSAVAAHGGARSRQTDIRKHGRDLAVNLSLHGWGVGYFAALRLREHITEAQRLLAIGEIRAAFGARDIWQLVEMVSRNELGGARNVARYRTLATTGLEIVRWLATLGAAGRRSGTRAGIPQSLVKACEAWLAASASTDDD